MMKFDLDNIIADIARNLDTTYRKENKYAFSKEYTLPNVKESDLINIGFTYRGLTTSTLYPYYTKDNLLAVYNDQLLHICETTSDIKGNVSYDVDEVNEKVDNILGIK